MFMFASMTNALKFSLSEGSQFQSHLGFIVAVHVRTGQSQPPFLIMWSICRIVDTPRPLLSPNERSSSSLIADAVATVQPLLIARRFEVHQPAQ